MPSIKYRADADSPWIEIPVIKGEDGKDYVLTEEDKQEIAKLAGAGGISDVGVGAPMGFFLPRIESTNYPVGKTKEELVDNLMKYGYVQNSSAAAMTLTLEDLHLDKAGIGQPYINYYITNADGTAFYYNSKKNLTINSQNFIARVNYRTFVITQGSSLQDIYYWFVNNISFNGYNEGFQSTTISGALKELMDDGVSSEAVQDMIDESLNGVTISSFLSILLDENSNMMVSPYTFSNSKIDFTEFVARHGFVRNQVGFAKILDPKKIESIGSSVIYKVQEDGSATKVEESTSTVPDNYCVLRLGSEIYAISPSAQSMALFLQNNLVYNNADSGLKATTIKEAIDELATREVGIDEDKVNQLIDAKLAALADGDSTKYPQEFNWPGWDKATWQDIKSLVASGTAIPEDVTVGATKAWNYNGETYGDTSSTMRIVALDDGITFQAVSGLTTRMTYDSVSEALDTIFDNSVDKAVLDADKIWIPSKEQFEAWGDLGNYGFCWTSTESDSLQYGIAPGGSIVEMNKAQALSIVPSFTIKGGN